MAGRRDYSWSLPGSGYSYDWAVPYAYFYGGANGTHVSYGPDTPVITPVSTPVSTPVAPTSTPLSVVTGTTMGTPVGTPVATPEAMGNASDMDTGSMQRCFAVYENMPAIMGLTYAHLVLAWLVIWALYLRRNSFYYKHRMVLESCVTLCGAWVCAAVVYTWAVDTHRLSALAVDCAFAGLVLCGPVAQTLKLLRLWSMHSVTRRKVFGQLDTVVFKPSVLREARFDEQGIASLVEKRRAAAGRRFSFGRAAWWLCFVLAGVILFALAAWFGERPSALAESTPVGSDDSAPFERAAKARTWTTGSWATRTWAAEAGDFQPATLHGPQPWLWGSLFACGLVLAVCCLASRKVYDAYWMAVESRLYALIYVVSLSVGFMAAMLVDVPPVYAAAAVFAGCVFQLVFCAGVPVFMSRTNYMRRRRQALRRLLRSKTRQSVKGPRDPLAELLNADIEAAEVGRGIEMRSLHSLRATRPEAAQHAPRSDRLERPTQLRAVRAQHVRSGSAGVSVAFWDAPPRDRGRRFHATRGFVPDSCTEDDSGVESGVDIGGESDSGAESRGQGAGGTGPYAADAYATGVYATDAYGPESRPLADPFPGLLADSGSRKRRLPHDMYVNSSDDAVAEVMYNKAFLTAFKRFMIRLLEADMFLFFAETRRIDGIVMPAAKRDALKGLVATYLAVGAERYIDVPPETQVTLDESLAEGDFCMEALREVIVGVDAVVRRLVLPMFFASSEYQHVVLEL